jgi:hypothetical protein
VRTNLDIYVFILDSVLECFCLHSRNINKTATTKNKIKKTIRATKLKQKQNKQTTINCNKKVIIKNIKKPNKVRTNLDIYVFILDSVLEYSIEFPICKRVRMG